MKLIIRNKPLSPDEIWKLRTKTFLDLSPAERIQQTLYLMCLNNKLPTKIGRPKPGLLYKKIEFLKWTSWEKNF